MDAGVYPTHAVNLFLGEPEGVEGFGSHATTGVDSHAAALLRYPATDHRPAATASMLCTLEATLPNRLAVYCTDGHILFDDFFLRPRGDVDLPRQRPRCRTRGLHHPVAGRRLHLPGPGGDALRAGRGTAVADGPVGGHPGRGPDPGALAVGGRPHGSSDCGTVMERLTGVIQPYAWGSPTVIPELLGVPPTGEPQAELWFGAHPLAPSTVRGEPLDDLVDRDPDGVVGPASVASFGPRLPFLLKIIAADRPLSLQAHPSREQAEAGYAREQAAGVPRDAPNRLYRDGWPKPEVLCARCGRPRRCAASAIPPRRTRCLPARGRGGDRAGRTAGG